MACYHNLRIRHSRPEAPIVLREEQIDIRRQRAVEGKFRIQNLGRNRVFSDYQVSNPASGGQYQVSIRGRRQRLHLPRFSHQHAAHLQAH